jgi:hypothetical protein
VFDELMASWAEFGGKLSVALLQRFENAERVKKVCSEVRLTNMDPHLLFSQVGERLGLLPEATVAAAFANLCAQAGPDVFNSVLDPIRHLLPHDGPESPGAQSSVRGGGHLIS